MKRSYRDLAALSVPVALAVSGSLVIADFGPALESRDLRGLLAFVGIAILAEAMALDFGSGHTQKSQSSLVFLPFLGMIVLFPPHIAALAVAFVIAVSQLLLRRNSLARSFLNISFAVLSASAAGLVSHLVPDTGLFFVIGFAAAAATFFATNILLASAALAQLTGTALKEMFAQTTGPSGSNFTYDLLASPIAIVPVLLYDATPELGVLVIVLPLILINYSYVSKRQVIEANKDLLRALIKAIEVRDPYTSGHSERVAFLSKAIARDMGLSPRQVDQIETAALLHDIGKIDPVFETVLRKPFDLSPEERALIQTHSARGAELLKDLSSVRPEVVAAVMHHHERHDGAGYPAGLAGDEIPVAARIIMLSDSIDAMLSDRPYRKALTIKAVRDELRRCAGTQFNPEICQVVLREKTLEHAFERVKEDSATTFVSESMRVVY
jgi:putative nucleotidyltransferase with HDIG domain